MFIFNEGEYTEETRCYAEAYSGGNKKPGIAPGLPIF